MKKVLDRLYNDPVSPAAFAGVDRLWKEAKKELEDRIRRRDVKEYLENHRTYTLMRPRRVHFPRTKTVPAGFMTDVQVDLADFQALSRHNKGNRYLLVGIDVLSKRVFGIPIKSKKADDMINGFRQLFLQMPMKPHRIFSDKGTEFKSKQISELFKEEEIDKHESTHSVVKAALAERAIRNIKNRMYRFFAQHQKLNWIDTIQQILNGINNSPSRVLDGLCPNDVNFKNAQEIWEKNYGKEMRQSLFPKEKSNDKSILPKGQTVRMSRGKSQFEKGYIPNYGDEILEVDAVKTHMRPIRYKLRDEKGEPFKSFFYREELAPVRKGAETTFRIEKVFRKKKRTDGTFDILVKFIDDPDRQWIHESQLV